MGFSFGFTEEDLNAETPIHANINNTTTANEPFENPIDNAIILSPPKLTSLQDFSSKLIGTRISYETVPLNDGFTLYRRELFDVKHQLMMEEEYSSVSDSCSGNNEFNILIGQTDEDLVHGVYEGGLKSWECSFDLINKLETSAEYDNGGFNLIELGCGTGLPSLYMFKKLLMNGQGNVKLILSDYNYEVLRLVTLPNLLIIWCLTRLSKEELVKLQTRKGIEGNIREGEIDVTDELIEKFNKCTKKLSIEISFISGSWSRPFMELVHQAVPALSSEKNLIITSETIYSIEISPVISEILVELSMPTSMVLLGAKDIYFGVGGSINQFLSYLEKRNQRMIEESAGQLELEWEVEKVNSELKRSVVSLRRVS